MKRSLILFPLIASLTACGGSDNDSNTTPVNPQPTQLASVISGELTAKTADSITIGGNQTIKVTTSTRTIDLNQFKIGMMVTVSTKDNQVAKIHYDNELQAPVTFNDGKTLKVAGLTIVGIKDISQYPLNTIVEISGYPVDGNTIQATYIEKEELTETLSEIEGVVTNLKVDEIKDTSQTTFTIGHIQVNMNSINSNLKNGVWVEVKGIMHGTETHSEITNLTIDNAMVELEHQQPAYDNAKGKIEIEGIISWISKDKTHLVMNQNLSVNIASATFDGIFKNQLKPGLMIEAEGLWDTNAQNLKASEIEFDQDDTHVDHIPNLAPEFELSGYANYDAELNTVSINGYSFILTPTTEIDGIALSNLQGSDWVELSGYEQANQHIAMEVEYDGGVSVDIDLEGKVINKDGVADIFGYQANDNSLNQFIGKHVELECTYQGKNIVSNCVQDLDD